MTLKAESHDQLLLCSDCFSDEGLRIDALHLGHDEGSTCPNCKSIVGRKLTQARLQTLAQLFFVAGTTIRGDYGSAPAIQLSQHSMGKSEIVPSPWLKADLKLIENTLKVGFVRYGPRLWMVGEVEPLKNLQDPIKRSNVVNRIMNEYPKKKLAKDSEFYRLRVCPRRPADPGEYDSPPLNFTGVTGGRLDSPGFPVMYGSQDLDVCIHECRAATEDDVYVATLKLQREISLLDLTSVLKEEATEFESLDMAVHMLFLARSHSYEISRAISIAAKNAGFDGVIYPSFFGQIRTGGNPFETAFGLSLRRHLPDAARYAEAFTIPNLALFGRPIESSLVRVACINRLIVTRVEYSKHFGPATY